MESEAIEAKRRRFPVAGADTLPLKGTRILIVEDEGVIAMELQSIFEDAGADVAGPALTLRGGLALAEAEELTAAILDYRLGLDSIEPVAEALERRGIPFCFYSGQTKSSPEEMDRRHVVVIAKPASPSVLIDTVASLLREGC